MNVALDIRDPRNYPYPQNLGMILQEYIDETRTFLKDNPRCTHCGEMLTFHTLLYVRCSDPFTDECTQPVCVRK